MDYFIGFMMIIFILLSLLLIINGMITEGVLVLILIQLVEIHQVIKRK